MFENMGLAILFDIFLHSTFKMTASFANIAGTSTSTRKFIHYQRLQIIKNWFFIWKIIFYFERIKNYFNVKFVFTKLLGKRRKFFFDIVWKVADTW